jgi:DNA helicase HerA-like ATPase
MSDIARVQQVVPALLLAALERRYLAGLDPSAWRLTPVGEPGRPILREITGMGQPRAGETWGQVVPSILTGLHRPGHALITLAHGHGGRHRLLVGTRRIPGGVMTSTDDVLSTQLGVLRAHIPGLEMGEARRLDGHELPEIHGFLQSAPALGVITGVPAYQAANASVSYGLDRIAEAVGGRGYAVMIVATPLPPEDLDEAADRCRALRGSLHSLVRQSASQQHTTGTSTSTSATKVVMDHLHPAVPPAIRALAQFCANAGDMLGKKPMGHGIALLLGSGVSQVVADLIGETTSEQHGTSESTSVGRTVEVLDPFAEAGETLLLRHLERLEAAAARGWWSTSLYIAAEDQQTLDVVSGTLRAMWAGDSSTVEPVRLTRPATWIVRNAMVIGGAISLRPYDATVGHPLGHEFDALATCVSSDELAATMPFPRRDTPGIPVCESADFALNAPPATADAVPMGAVIDPSGTETAPFTLDADSLNRHVFITGMTGYGKTTTAVNLLLSAHARLGLPFLVIEPVKAEYRSLTRHLPGGVRVFTIGDDGGLPLRINPFVPVDSVPLLRHIDLLKAVFNASFPMYGGMPYVLEEAMLRIYQERGWDLNTSVNRVLGPNPAPEDRDVLVPSLVDLHDKIEDVLRERRYGEEIHQNMGAALRARLRSLMVGAKGATLAGIRPIPPHELFETPCVIELRNLGDDDEKCFVMALLLSMLYEYAEARQGPKGLRHITLIEEAHRLLRAARPAGMESADVQAKAVGMFTDMLAEMRSYGEGFVVADQIPTKLAPEILKNTNVKIGHRLSAADERAVLGGTIGLSEEQSRQLTNLRPGTAIVHDDRVGSPLLVRMRDKPTAPSVTTQPAQATTVAYLRRNGGCRYCPSPCTSLGSVGDVRTDATLDESIVPLMRAVLLDDAETAWHAWTTWLTTWQADCAEANVTATKHLTYCAITQSAQRWLHAAARTRSELTDQAVTPADRLAADRAGRHIARLCTAWQGTFDTSVFDAAQTQVRSLIAAHPPRRLPGCASCEVPCQMLPFTATDFAKHRSALVAQVTNKTPIPTKVRYIQNLLGVTPDGPQHYLHCLLTVSVPAGDPHLSDLLRALRVPAD